MAETTKPQRALLDVKLLIALIDPRHASSARAHEWFAANQQAKAGVATCPIVQNGVARILSQPAYSSGAQFSARPLLNRLKIPSETCAIVGVTTALQPRGTWACLVGHHVVLRMAGEPDVTKRNLSGRSAATGDDDRD